MGRTVFVEEVVQQYINELTHKKINKLGLVLGHDRHVEQKEFIIHLVETPLQQEEQEDNANEKDKAKNAKSKPITLEEWDADLVKNHAVQVTRMLLGGFDVLGIFVCTLNESLSANDLVHIRKVLSTIYKVLNQEHFYVNFESNERLIIHISCAPNKVTCKSVNITSSLAFPKPVDLKFTSGPTKWTRLNCQFAIDLYIPQSKENTQKPLANQFKGALKPLIGEVRNAIATFDNCLKSEDELLDPAVSNSTKPKRGSDKNKKTIDVNMKQTAIDVDLYIDMKATTSDKFIVHDSCDVVMKCNGSISGRTYVPPKSTVGEGLKLLKLDLLRSLVSRCDIHCDDLLVIEEEQRDRVVVHELPRRIFAPFPGLELSVSDYLFPGEVANDSLDAFRELLNLKPNVEDIEDGCERFPDSVDLASSTLEEDDSGVPVEEMLPVKPPKSCNYICLSISIAVGVLATLASVYVIKS